MCPSFQEFWSCKLLLMDDNIQMQFSKTSQEGNDLFLKIEKLNTEINNASEYLDLEKCANKLARIREKTSVIPEKKKRKEIKAMLEVAQGLIQLKTKKFKKRIIDKFAIGNAQPQVDSKQKKLNFSKSMENFDFAKLQSPKARPKNEEDVDAWKSITTVHQPNNSQRRLEKRVEELEEELSDYKRKIVKIEEFKSSPTLSQMCYRLGEQQGLFQQQLGFKIREKGLEIDELKQKLRRSEQKNQQMKNRLQNEQKRQQDYIQNLKNNITNLSSDLQTSNRQNKKLQEEINKIYYVCDGYKLEVKKLIEEVEHLNREKKRSQQNEVLRMKDNSIKRELEALELQEKYMRDMQSMLQAQKDQKGVLLEKTEQMEKRNAVILQENLELIAENERLEEMLEIKVEEITEIKKEMLGYIDHKNKCEQELANTRSVVASLQSEILNSKQRKAFELQKKADNLKQIKDLFEAK